LLLVKQYRHPYNTSNTYYISCNDQQDIYLIDAGYCNDLKSELNSKQRIKGVFLTHSHFDHIADLNLLSGLFPDLTVYCSSYSKKGLFSEKLNLSFYHETPFVFKGDKVVVLEDGSIQSLFDGIDLRVIQTPGHDPGCLTYQINNYLFTGDSFIPGHEVVTKLKGGSRLDSNLSLTKIKSIINQSTIICPGHFDISRNIL
jgi:hydroxyacylglutathione hydrolase